MTELAVLVPVLGRPQNVAPLVRSFEQNCPNDALLVFIPSSGDTEEIRELDSLLTNRRVRWAWHKDYETWPQKINWGVELDQAEWYLLAADDITFTPGWWDATRELRNSTVGVIGTNDALPGQPGNPAVAAGSHTCHPLISADYIRDYGTIDEKGKAVHDGYRHWCVDNELCATAMIRDKWAFCRDAVLIHNHPLWGRGDWDDTYILGNNEEQAAHDIALWNERRTNLLHLP